MAPPPNQCDGGVLLAGASSQAQFHRRWDHLHDPHVRALAWLLDAPDLLDTAAPQWEGRIASLSIDVDRPGDGTAPRGGESVAAWLAALNSRPEPLHAWLGTIGTPRLGRYAEKLFAYYFAWCGNLVAHGLQVRAPRFPADGVAGITEAVDEVGTVDAVDTAGTVDTVRTDRSAATAASAGMADSADGTATAGAALKSATARARGTASAAGRRPHKAGSDTIGEFDFLLRDGPSLWHLELATKFYLFEAAGPDPAADFIGPNLADTLAAKMDKILHRQLGLSQHPAARAVLPQPVGRAQALIKGWLFYHLRDGVAADSTGARPVAFQGAAGVAAAHCRGRWCSVSEFAHVEAPGFQQLARLAWLAPARSTGAGILDKSAMQMVLQTHFATDTMPLLVASMAQESGVWREMDRCFVVPDDWRARVHERHQRTVLRRERSG